ncbi:hypothetical protein BJV82DRAFT_147591 [Fennellomyces sp. T-0311]|nr:hypothetical protein BJV82DRAFT_147591 [Fennellomyces sp. T-0311]
MKVKKAAWMKARKLARTVARRVAKKIVRMRARTVARRIAKKIVKMKARTRMMKPVLTVRTVFLTMLRESAMKWIPRLQHADTLRHNH